MNDGGRGGGSEEVLLHPPPVSLLSGQHALVTLPLIQVVSGLGKVHVETARVLLVGTGAQTDTVAWGEERRGNDMEKAGEEESRGKWG